jgi:hypothetical protein
MIGRSNKRGIRRASTRVRLAVAAAVLVGGGAAGVVAVAASNHGPVSAASAGYYSHHELSETHAMSDAMGWWHKSPSTSLSLISQMVPMRNMSMTPWHTHMLALQRGTVVAQSKNEFVLKSANGQFQFWHVNGHTAFLNVGGSTMGMNAMTGGGTSMTMPSGMQMNIGAKRLAPGNLVFVFGQKVGHQLVAQLVLFAATTTTTVTPTATPTMTATATPTATSTATATPTATVPVPTGTSSTAFSGLKS